METQSPYARILADTVRKIINQEGHEETPVCQRCHGIEACVCPVHEPVPSLGLRDILLSAGYNIKSLTEDLEVCASCFEQYEGSLVEFMGLHYCCSSCAEGRDCDCQPLEAKPLDESENRPHEAGIDRKVNTSWSESEQEAASKEMPPTFFIKRNRFWEESDSPAPPQHSSEEATVDARVNRISD